MKQQIVYFSIFLIILTVKTDFLLRNRSKLENQTSQNPYKISNNTDTVCAHIVKKFTRDIGILNKWDKLKIKENCKLNIYEYFMDSLIMNEAKYKMIRFFVSKKLDGNENINMKKLFFDRINLIQKIFKNINDCTIIKKRWRRKLRKVDRFLDKIKREKCGKKRFCTFGKRKNIDTLFSDIKNIILNSKEKKVLTDNLGSLLTSIYLHLLNNKF
jgi:hypothetical protein